MAGGNTKHIVTKIKEDGNLLENYIQKASVNSFFDDENEYKIKEEVKNLLELLDKQDLLGNLNIASKYLKKNQEKIPTEIQGNNQEAEIAKKVMPAVNAVISFLQSYYTYGKSCVNSAANYLGKDAVFSFTNPEAIELVRQALTNEAFTLQQVAGLMKANEGTLVLNETVPQEVKDMLEPIITQLEIELKAKSVKNGSTLADELKKLQSGEDKFYNEFFAKECFTNNPKVKEACIAAIEFLIDLAVKATSILKDVANYVYSYYKSEEKLFTKTAAEEMSDLNSNRGGQPVEWAKLSAAVSGKYNNSEFEYIG